MGRVLLGWAPNDFQEKNIETSVFLNQETVEVVVEVVVVEVVVTVVVVEVDWHIGHNNWEDQLAKELMLMIMAKNLTHARYHIF